MPNSIDRAAVIAIGSNSTRMLTANLDSELSRPARGRVETRLFLALDGENHLRPDALSRLIHAVSQLKQMALDAGAQSVLLTATAALRDSADSALVTDALLETSGLPLNIISGKQEAAWSFLGAAYPYADAGLLGVADIGGGSTEIALGSAKSLRFTASLQLGASRLFTLCPVNSFDDMVPALAQAERVLDNSPLELEQIPGRWLLVGGTGTALIGLLRGRLMAVDEGDQIFTHAQVIAVLRKLAKLSPEGRAALPGMTQSREHILPTGLCVLSTLMTRLDIDEMAVTTRNNCDGCLYAMAHGLNVKE